MGWKRALSWSLCLAMLAGLCPVFSAFAGEERTQEEWIEYVGTYSVDESVPHYRAYARDYENAGDASRSVTIEAAQPWLYTENGEEAPLQVKCAYEGMPGESLYMDEDSMAEYRFTIEEAGFYSVSFTYYPVEGKGAAIQRSIFLDGALPYAEMAGVELPRLWSNSVALEAAVRGQDTPEWRQDNQGNDLKPAMKEAPAWVETYLYDSDGYVTDNLRLYLTAGEHSLVLLSQREPVVLRRIVLGGGEAVPDYQTQKAAWDAQGAAETAGQRITVEAENASLTSSQMLYPSQDQTSVSINPSSARYLLNNAMGGNSWRLSGQWIEWDFAVEEAGYYAISLHVNQNYKKGMYVSRKIWLDGAVPFKEMEDYGFVHKSTWRMETLSDDEGEPYMFYLEAGTHTIRMEAVLGGFSEIMDTVRDSIAKLNAIYRKVISLTGVSPDEFQDYQIETSIPELREEMVVVRDQLTWAIDELRRVAGRSSDRERVLLTMRDQLTELIADGERYAKVLGSFKINVRACGTWLNDALGQQLGLDALYIHSPDVTVKQRHGGFGAGLWYELRRLMYSFVIDYNQVGNVAAAEEGEVVTLWVGSGRDQANIIKSLIDEDFAPNNSRGANVNVMLVDMGTLLQATLAGQGPDAAIQVGMDMPLNYGLRNAVMDLSRFADLDEVKEQFFSAANVPYEFDGATYGLPETLSFLMMFYRKDILKEIGLELPQTWDDVKIAMAVLNQNQMEVGMLPSEQVYAMLLYQNGGQYYNADGSRCLLDSAESVDAFKTYCEFYTDYKLDKETSVEERFRTGEAAIILADYTLYNNLQVSAPDIKGLWGFAPVPGTVREDGSIDRTVLGGGSAAVMMSAAKAPEAAWEFLKWWTGAAVQTAYGREMESLMGAAARIPAANREAFSSLPWPMTDMNALNAQMEWVEGTPQVPGGYYTYRNVANAFYKVTTWATDKDVNKISINTILKESPREALMDKVILINDEIRYKRKEFGLPMGS